VTVSDVADAAVTVAWVPLNITVLLVLVVLKLVPVMVTVVPAAPVLGLMPVIVGTLLAMVMFTVVVPEIFDVGVNNDAVISVEPVAIPYVRPVLDIVATLVFDELQVTELVKSRVVLSEYVPVAINCCVAPIAILGLAGVTAIEVSVA
jgi:hypothetical protein